MLWLGFTLMIFSSWMLARVPIISAYDPSRESMLAYASPSYETAIVITGLVNDCLGQFRTPIHHYSTLAIYNI